MSQRGAHSARGGRGGGRGARSKASTPATPAANLFADQKDICTQCGNTVTDEENGIQCERCNQWVHATCQGLNNEAYDLAQRNNSLKFFCNNCNGNSPDDSRMLQEILTEVRATKALQEKMQKQLLTQKDSILKEVDKKIEDKIESVVQARVADAFAEERDRKARENNLIIYNFKEPNTPDKTHAKEMDTRNISDYINSTIVPDGNIEITEAVRLGKEHVGSNPRVLRIKLKGKSPKLSILKNSQIYNEKQKNIQPKDKIYFNPDHTKKERDQLTQLRRELAELKKAHPEEHKNKIIRNFKIVEKRNKDEGDPPENSQAGET